MSDSNRNEYLDQVVAQQERLQQDLRSQRSAPAATGAAPPPRRPAEPLHVGLGTSFRYDPARDAYLVVPGAMQTILINAFCICRELQGVLVQAYVQWIVQDFSTAYRRLDFGDAEDPMRLVNLQLKE